MKDLIKALEQQADTPCAKFSCAKFQQCAEDSLACSAFAYYVQTGTAVHPFNDVAHRASGTGRMNFIGEVHPTRELFDDIENDRWAAEPGGGGWDERKAVKADELIQQTLDESGTIGLQTWLTTSVERAETTLRRAVEREDSI